MTLLKKIWKKSTAHSNRVCDNCSVIIQEDEIALCFHTDEKELFLCDPCIEKLFKQFKQEL